MINNNDLNNNEIKWFETILNVDCFDKAKIVDQINSSTIEKQYNEYYNSFIFNVNHINAACDVIKNGVAFEMRLFKQDKVPIQFLIHFMNGYINELEVFNADSSKITNDICIEFDDRVEVLLDI